MLVGVVAFVDINLQLHLPNLTCQGGPPPLVAGKTPSDLLENVFMIFLVF